ncbi:MAG: hypothetical protein IJ033_03385 [Clostridia bacterium]|nr:hypothetical protein [Clostridia bacterium]
MSRAYAKLYKKKTPMRNRLKPHRQLSFSVRSSHSVRCAAIVPSVSLSCTRRLASREISFVVNPQAITFASAVTAEVSSKDLIKKTKVYLPIDEDGNPDYQFMEDYIKSLPFSKKYDWLLLKLYHK